MWQEMQSALTFPVWGELLYVPLNANPSAVVPTYSAPPSPRFMSVCGPWWAPYGAETLYLAPTVVLVRVATIESAVVAKAFRRISWHSAQMWPFALFWPQTAPVCVVMGVPTGIVWGRVTPSGVPWPCGVWHPKHPSGDGHAITSAEGGVVAGGGVWSGEEGLP